MVAPITSLSLSAKREALARLHGRYGRAGRARRPHPTRILDEFCAPCGYHRQAALWLLNRPLRPTPPQCPGPKPLCEPAAVLPVLKALWLASDQLCGKLLRAVLLKREKQDGRTQRLDEPTPCTPYERAAGMSGDPGGAEDQAAGRTRGAGSVRAEEILHCPRQLAS